MKPAIVTETIEVAALQIGMHIHLDGGWLSHPFPRSSFKISSAEQLATLRSLGFERVRWSPQDSDLPRTASQWDAAEPDASETDADEPETAREAADEAIRAAKGEGDELNRSAATAPASELAQAPKPTPTPRELLSAQRQALAACERQFTDAARASKRVWDDLASRPTQAREAAQALTQQLVDKMTGAQELCIRLLSEGAGDKASAHALNVSVISLLMGRTFGLSEADMLDLGLGALLHDVGKADVNERYRHREDHHSAAEHKLYETHVAHGTAHAKRLGLTPGASLVIAQHHEHIDGSGFPLKLQSDRTTVLSRIVALVNRYDNLCNPSNPGKAITPHEAVALMFAQGKSKYDPAILGAFIKMMGVYPAGSVVQLTDDRYGLVVGVNSSRPLKPRVLVHEPKVPRDEALILDLEHAPGLGIRRSLKPMALPPATLGYLSPRPRVSYFFEPMLDGAPGS